MIIYPAPLYQDVQTLKSIFLSFDAWCQGYHLDYMDGHFVSHRMGSIDLINRAQRETKHPLWVHLMAYEPEALIAQLRLKKNSIVSVHYEASSGPQLIQQAKKIAHLNMHPSLAFNPQTDWQDIVNFIPFFDQLLVMGVEPGASGQAFIPKTISTLQILRDYIDMNGLQCSLVVDGGINEHTLPQIRKSGATGCALSSSIFSDEDPLEKFKKLCVIL